MAIPYDFSKIPAAPNLEIQVSAPETFSFSEPLRALVDTGADFSVVPLQYLLSVDAPETRSAFARGLWGKRQPVTLYLVDIRLEIGTFSGIEVIGTDDEDEAILGRNVLNKLFLLLEGPNQQIQILERVPKKL